MEISPDTWVFSDWHGLRLNATIVFTWVRPRTTSSTPGMTAQPPASTM